MIDQRDDLWIVTTDDCRLFSCHVETVGAHRQWIFVSTDKARHVGPVWQGPLTARELRSLVNDWWTAEKLSPA